MDRQPRLEILNSHDHRTLRLRPRPASAPHFVQVVPDEFPAIAATCPIFITKSSEDGRFYTGALFGFKPGENLLIDTDAPLPPYVPLDLRREAFFISGENMAIDRDSARFSESEGTLLFDDEGEPAPAIRQMQRLLGQFHAGLEESGRFLAEMIRHSLIEPVDVSLRFDDGEKINLRGLYTLSLDVLNALDDASVLDLFHRGYLQLAYCVAESLKQVPMLADRRNRLLVRGI